MEERHGGGKLLPETERESLEKERKRESFKAIPPLVYSFQPCPTF
jgi:hypothetical protein